MAIQKRQREQMRALCEELSEDDGIDPRDDSRMMRHSRKRHRKSARLCRQIERTLELAIAGELSDVDLNGLRVVSVVPGVDASHLLVTVTPAVRQASFCREEIERKLHAARGRLRAAVAEAITRKKTPILNFEVLEQEIENPTIPGEETE